MKVYLIRNKINEKKYVGQTTQTIDQRWIGHCNGARSKKGNRTVIKDAIRKYGPDSFEITLLEECSTKEELDAAEVRWIAKLKTMVDHGGYNLNSGGYGGQLNPSLETRLRLSKAKRGKKSSVTTKRRLSKIASSRKRPDKNKYSQEVSAYDGEGRFLYTEPSYSAMGRRTRIGVRSVQRCCDLRCGMRNLKWFFVPAGEFVGDLPDEYIQQARFSRKGEAYSRTREIKRVLKSRSVGIHIEKDGVQTEYPSISTAARALGVHPMRVKRAMDPKSLEQEFRVI